MNNHEKEADSAEQIALHNIATLEEVKDSANFESAYIVALSKSTTMHTATVLKILQSLRKLMKNDSLRNDDLRSLERIADYCDFDLSGNGAKRNNKQVAFDSGTFNYHNLYVSSLQYSFANLRFDN